MTEERALTLAEKMKALDLRDPKHIAWVMTTSGLFADVKDMTQALVKVQAGRELGLGAFASMQAFDIVEGKLRIGSGQLASWVKASEKYDYRVREHTAQCCRIEWLQRADDGTWESLGFSSWDEEDRDRAGTALKTSRGNATVWAKFPKAMMFNRAMSNGVATYCPDVVPTGNRVYTEGDDFGPMDAGYHERMEIDLGPAEVVEPEKPKNPATDEQKTKIMVMCRKCGVDDDRRHARMKELFGVESIHDLTKQQASEMIEKLAILENDIAQGRAPEPPDETPEEMAGEDA